MRARTPVSALILVGLVFIAGDEVRGSQQERLRRRPGYRSDEIGLSQGAWVKGRSFWQEVASDNQLYLLRFQPHVNQLSPESRGWAGYYLNYNHRQEDQQVLLTREPGPGTQWRIQETARKKNGNGFGYKVFTRIKPAAGPMKDWILSLKDNQFVLSKEGDPAPIYAELDDLNDGK